MTLAAGSTVVQYLLCHTCYEGCQGADHDLQCQRLFWYCILSYRAIENLGGVDVPCSADQIVPGLLFLLILRERVSCSLVNSSSLVGQVLSFSVMVLQLMFSTLHRNRHC